MWPYETHIGYKLNSVVWVRDETIPTEWPPLVGEVSEGLPLDGVA
jgi:hypothetical protein